MGIYPSREAAYTDMKKVAVTSKVNILLVEIVNRNFGDGVIADNTCYLLQHTLPFFSRSHYSIYHYNIFVEDYEMVSKADIIIFDGGGIIKYKREKFYYHITKILECAQEHEIPVYFCGVGVEGYDETDERCQMLKKALRYSCVKGISVRDDLETLQTGYLQGVNTPCCLVWDPAICTKKVYGIRRNSHSNTIGLGIIRHKIFEDNDIPQVGKEQQLEMWKSLTEELEARGYEWKLFVNGAKDDYTFALEVLEYLGKMGEREKYLFPRPTESRELVETIASFKGVVAARMHANIIAYSLGIPSIGLVWNDKLTFWGKRIGFPERFLTVEHFNGKEIADCLQKSIKEGAGRKKRHFQTSVYKPLKHFVRFYGKPLAQKKSKQTTLSEKNIWQKKLAATALGGYQLRYSGMNSPVTVAETIKNGFRYLETDVRFTADGRLVCVNSWSDKTYEKLGIPVGKYDKTGMPYEEFMKCRYYDGHYPVMDFEQLLHYMEQYRDWKLIVDIGKPAKDKVEAYAIKINELFSKNTSRYQKCMIRLQSRFDVDTFRRIKKEFSLMFYFPKKEVREKSGITAESAAAYCQKKKISWITMDKTTFDEDTALAMQKWPVKVCVFSCKTMGEIRDAVEKGAALVGSHYITVQQMEAFFPYGK